MALRSERQTVDFHSLMPLISAKLEREGTVKIPATGNSMTPLFRHGRDQVTLRGVRGQPLGKYDMILYRRPHGGYVLHRIVGEGEDGYVLRGDGQLWDEYPVRREWVIARVDGFHRGTHGYTCANLGYRVYAVIWTKTVWVRRGLSKVWRGLGNIKRYLILRSRK